MTAQPNRGLILRYAACWIVLIFGVAALVAGLTSDTGVAVAVGAGLTGVGVAAFAVAGRAAKARRGK